MSGSGEFYDRTTGQPSESRPWCPHFHIGGAGGVIDGKLYVAGGDGTFGLSSALDIYDAVTNKWTVGSPMPAPRSTATGVVLGKKLYYTPSTNRWATAATMPTPRRLLGAKRIALEGQAYIVTVGGSEFKELFTTGTANEVYAR